MVMTLENLVMGMLMMSKMQKGEMRSRYCSLSNLPGYCRATQAVMIGTLKTPDHYGFGQSHCLPQIVTLWEVQMQ